MQKEKNCLQIHNLYMYAISAWQITDGACWLWCI